MRVREISDGKEGSYIKIELDTQYGLSVDLVNSIGLDIEKIFVEVLNGIQYLNEQQEVH